MRLIKFLDENTEVLESLGTNIEIKNLSELISKNCIKNFLYMKKNNY